MDLFYTSVSDKSIQLVNQVLKSGFLNQGPMVNEFEKLLSTFGLVNPITTNSCTSALHMALQCCNVTGGEVILPAQTFIATGLAVLMAGAIPIFSDIRKDGNIDPNNIEQLINKKTKAIIAVHWGGRSCDLEHINSFGIPVIEDAAHALGGKYKQQVIGSISDFTCFSFQSIKMVTTGDGGAICVKNDKYIQQIKKMRWFGIDKDSMTRNFEGDRNCIINSLGYKYHMNDIDAAIGIGNLETLKTRLEKRQYNAQTIIRHARKQNNIYFIPSSTHWLLVAIVNNRQNFIQSMKDNNIPVSVVDRGIDTHPIFNNKKELPIQRWFDKHQIAIPVHEALTTTDLDNIINTINKGW
jgi:perosamine synthetase